MFYSVKLLCKKRGRLGIAWVAGTIGFNQTSTSFLTKRELQSVNVRAACDEIVFPNDPMALRLAAILMLGVIRIYQKQTYYLLFDIEEMVKDIRKKKTISIDLVEENGRFLSLVLATREGEIDELQNCMSLPIYSKEALVSTTNSYTTFNTPEIDSISSILRSQTFHDNFAINNKNCTLKSITLPDTTQIMDFENDDDFNGPLDPKLFESMTHSLDVNEMGFDLNIQPDIPLDQTIPSDQSNALLSPASVYKQKVKAALNQCSLEPIEEEQFRHKRRKKASHLIVDTIKELTNLQIRECVENYTDTTKHIEFPNRFQSRYPFKTNKELMERPHWIDYSVSHCEIDKYYFLASKHRDSDSTTSSTNFSKIIESSVSASHSMDSLRNTHSSHSNILLHEATVESIGAGNMSNHETTIPPFNLSHINNDSSLVSPQRQFQDDISDLNINGINLSNEYLSLDNISTDRLNQNLSFGGKNNDFIEKFREVMSTSNSNVYLSHLYPEYPTRKLVAALFYNLLKYAFVVKPSQNKPYGRIKLKG